MSFHYLHSQRFGEAWEFSLRAADRAVAVYANTEAAEFYERAITAARRLPQITPGRWLHSMRRWGMHGTGPVSTRPPPRPIAQPVG